MANWKDIHPELNYQLQMEWYDRNFTAEQTKEWIDTGLNPTDYQFAVYLRDVLTCNPEEALNFGDLETLKEQHQEYLQSQASNSDNESEIQQLAKAIRLSFGIFSPDGLLAKRKFSDQELEPYLSEKRLDLKKYFVFNLGKEVNAKSKVTVSDESGKIRTEPLPNVRSINPLLTEHLTKLFNDSYQKNAIAFAGKHTNQPAIGWTDDKLDQKIENGEECYITFDKTKIDVNSNYLKTESSSITQLGKLRWPIIVLAVEASPQVRVFQSKKNVLDFLRKNDFQCRAVSCQEEIIGEQDYCLYHQTCLAKLTEKENIPNIQEIDTFETWFNGNCGYVINKDNAECPFHIWLVIYEPERKEKNEEVKVKEDIFPMKFWKSKNLVRAEKKAQEIKKELQKNDWQVNPFSLIHWKADKYTTFNDLVREPFVRKIKLPCEVRTGISETHYWGQGRWGPPHGADLYQTHTTYYPNKNPDAYLKPLDVVWVKMNTLGFNYHHVGVYLGNNWVCHFSSEVKSRETNRTIITSWDEFVKNCVDGEVFAYHPVLPFKHYELIAQQIDWARGNEYDRGLYCLPNNNCEHHANSFVFGIDYSEQIRKEPNRKFWGGWNCGFCDWCKLKAKNNGKGSTVKLTNEIEKTNSKLGKTTGNYYNQIKTEYEAKTVVPHKDCRIM